MISPLPYGIPAPVVLPILEKVIGTFLRHKKLTIVVISLLMTTGLASCHLLQRITELSPIVYGPEFKSVKALALYETGAYSKAAAQYREDYHRFLEAQPGIPPNLLFLLRRDHPAAMEWAKRELETNRESVDGLLTLAQAFYDSDELGEAWACTARVLSIYWNNTDALLMAALIATKDPSRGDPIEYLNIALRTGTAARNLVSFINALEITGLLESYSRKDRPYALLAHYYRVLRIHDRGMTDRVIKTARRAIRRNDHPAESLFSVGLMFEKTGERHKALQAYNAAVDMAGQTTAHYRAAGLYSDAEDALHAYLRLKEGFRAARHDRFHIAALADHLMARQEWYAMVQFMREAIEVDRDNLTAHMYQAWALTQLGERHQAKEVFLKIMALEPRSPIELESQSWAAQNLGDHRQQEFVLHKSIQLDAVRYEPHSALATIYKNTGRFADALREFEAAWALGGYGNVNERHEYCELYRNVGDANRAQACFQPT
jgi:tetratricopeptide (TPR) repeat protein